MPIVSYKNNSNTEYTLGMMTESGLENIIIASDGFYSVYYTFNAQKVSRTGKILHVCINESNRDKSYILLDCSEDNFNRRERIYFEQIYYIRDLTPNDAYRIAVKHGFQGTEQDWIDSMRYGKSAYEVACDNGFEGSEEEWLDSLIGPKGDAPIRGVDYWTEEDIEEIKKEINQKIDSGVADIHQSITNSAESAERDANKAQTYYNETVKLNENVQKNTQFVSEAVDNIRSTAVEVSAKAEDVKKNTDLVAEAKGSIRLIETSVKEQAGLVNQAVKESLEGAKKAEQFAHEAELHKKDIDAAIEDSEQFARDARDSKNTAELIKNEILESKAEVIKQAKKSEDAAKEAESHNQSAQNASNAAIAAKNDAENARDTARTSVIEVKAIQNEIQTESEEAKNTIQTELDDARNVIHSELEEAKNTIQTELSEGTAIAEEAKRTAEEALNNANSIYDRSEEANEMAELAARNALKANDETGVLLDEVKKLNADVKDTLIEAEAASGVVSDLVNKARTSEANTFNYAKSAAYSMEKAEEHKNASELAQESAENAASDAANSAVLAEEYKNTIQESIDSIKNAEETVVTHEKNAAGYAEDAKTSKEEAEAIINTIDEKINKADTAMQPSVYDPNNIGKDVFGYTDEKTKEVQDDLNLTKEEIEDARSLTDALKYDKIGDAIRGTIDLARTHMHALLIDYKAFSIVFVDELPEVGENRTFYLIPNSTGNGYDKYWYVTNPEGEGPGKWDTFGGSSTIVVSALPEVGDPDIDYILKTTSGCLYYKYIDGKWEVVAGSLAYISDTELPSVEVGNEFTDYYIKDSESESYAHYRFINGNYRQVGASSDIKNLINTISEKVDKNTFDISTNTSNISNLSKSIDKLTEDMQNVAVDSYTYYHTITKSEENDNYVLTLWQVKDEVEEIASSTVLPATGGGSSSSSTTITIERVTPSPFIITTKDPAVIELNFSCVDADGESVDATYTWKKDKTVISSGSMVQGKNTFDMSDHCVIGTQKFTLTVTDETGSVSVKSWTIQKVDVRIESNFNDRYTNVVGRAVNFPYTPYGAIPKTIHFILDGVELDTIETGSSGTLQSYSIPAQPHGTHLFECYITATVNNTPVETDHIYKDIIWYDEESDIPVIGCIYRNDYYGILNAVQYNTIPIPYNVYDPNTNNPNVTLIVDGKVESELVLTQVNNVWNFKASTIGEHTLEIKCRDTSVIIKILVTDLGVDISPITGNLEFDFNPVGRNNSSADRLWSDSINDEIKMTVSDNFDWINGGYQIDENGDQFFRIKAGQRAFINYNLFAGSVDNNISTQGMEFKVIFKVENVQDVNATWLTCMNDEKPVGIELKAHEGYLMTSASDASNPNSYLYMPYSEEDIIELEMNALTLDQDNTDATSYIMSYEDGVGLRALIYDASHRLYQYNPVPITIGSDQCDIRIYRMKAYSAALTDSNILTNFIADARNSDDMIDRYNRNQIYDENGNLSPEHLAEICSNVKIIKIDCPYFTNDKKDYVKNTSAQCIHADGDPILDNWIFSNGYHSGQGTTSNEYGYAARNLDLIFNCDGIHDPNDKIKADPNYISELRLGDGTLYKGNGLITFTRTSVGTNWMNIKVNVASSENANNALLQKRFNDYLPYTSLAQKRNPFVKNSMEFVNCIIFIRENSPDLSSHREFLDNEWHFYAIGCIGDSKKTDFTRAYDQEDPNEFTMEISDNTLNNSTFQSGVYMDGDVRKIETPDEVLGGETTAHNFVYPILPSEWNENNGRYAALYADAFDGDGSYEMRYGCKGDFKDGKLIVKSEENYAQLDRNANVWRAFYRWVLTSTDEEFRNELKEWFVEDSAIYFYIFTHHFTMIDNRAKNTFWHFARTSDGFRKVSKPVVELIHVYHELVDDKYVKTSDTSIVEGKQYYTEHAFDLWDYDNDTALGINNSGELTMSYGMEDIDYKEEGNPASGWLYNGADSVFWCRVRDLLSDKCDAMYQTIDNRCWSASNIIEEFDTWQERFPEEIWRLNIERLYIRTYQGGGLNGGKPAEPTPRFLRSMMQGRKKYQRRQWVRDQESYFGTKHLTSNITSDQIMFRCNTPIGDGIVVTPNYDLRIIPFSSMYICVMFGNSAPTKIRAKAGQEYEIKCPFSQMSDTAVLIYNASRIQGLNDLSACYIHDNDFSKASKLKILVIGNDTEGYNNPFLQILNMGNNTLLEHLNVINCHALAGSLNLSNCNNLTHLYAEGSALTSITFSSNGKVQTAHLPGSINTLTMRYLNYLTDLQVESWDNMENLTIHGGIVDMLGIVTETADTVQILNLAGIDWELGNTDLLNTILKMNSSILSGKVFISGPIRNQEILSYANAWNDLEIDFDESYLVQQHKVTYVNADPDNTFLYSTYVDKGSIPIDPYAEGLIEIPTLEANDQYINTFGEYNEDGEYIARSGWDGIDDPVIEDRIVVAKYTKTVRNYTVTWYARRGVSLGSKVVPYGSEAVYEGDIPTDTSEEETYTFNLFKGWDASTGFIRKDTDVYAIWDRAQLPPVGKELKDMSFAEMYAVAKSEKAAEYFEDKDYFDFTMGHDFDFNNVKSEVLCENLILDGATAIDKDIMLFDDENPQSFTMAIDFKFGSTESNNTLVSCFDENGLEGFRLRYSSNPNIQWGDKNTAVGNSTYRDIVVLRYVAGTNILYIYHAKADAAGKFNPTVINTAMVRSRATTTKNLLTFGAVRYIGDGGHDEYGKGCIYSCKIWYDDIGHNNAMKLATWCHETVRMHYRGAGIYRLAGNTSKRSAASFVANNALSDKGYHMNSTGGNIGGFAETDMLEFCNGRIFDAFPVELQSIIKQVKIPTSAGNTSKDIVNAECKVYLEAYREVDASITSEPYASEGTPISWYVAGSNENAIGGNMTANATRIRFKGRIIDDDTRYFFSESDPAQIPTNNVVPGDIWIDPTKTSSDGYMFISREEIDYLGIFPDIEAENGGWLAANAYWLRSPFAGYGTNYYWSVMKSGMPNNISNATSSNAVVINFSF